MRPAGGEQVIDGMALQTPDLHRFSLARVEHAGPFAQDLGRAGAGTGAAHDIRLEDRLRRAGEVFGANLVDEGGNVDAGRAGGDARRLVAIEAAIRLDDRLARCQRRMQVGKRFLRLGIERSRR